MKFDNQGRERFLENTLPITGTDGLEASESDTAISITMDITSLAEETAPTTADYLVTYDAADAEHKRVALSDFLSFPPVGLQYDLYEVETPNVPIIHSWNKNVTAPAQWIMCLQIAGGGGGGGGMQDASTSNHSGGGGGGGAKWEKTPMIPASLVKAAGGMRVGTGGTGGYGAIGSSVAGSAATAGQTSSASFLTSETEVSTSAGGGGGGGTASAGSSGAGGSVLGSLLEADGDSGSQGDYNANAAAPGLANWGGAGGGGASGYVGGAPPTVFNPAVGGYKSTNSTIIAAAGVNGAGVADGTDGADGQDTFPMLMGGYGGGGSGNTNTTGFSGGDGGRGGYPGGGGGGGGAGTNGIGHAGMGGSGGDGLIGMFQFY